MPDGDRLTRPSSGSISNGCLPLLAAAFALWGLLAGVGYLVWEIVK